MVRIWTHYCNEIRKYIERSDIINQLLPCPLHIHVT